MGLNLKVLVPMYFEGNYEELCERADALGMDSLTEDEQYFINNYNRLDEMYKNVKIVRIITARKIGVCMEKKVFLIL